MELIYVIPADAAEDSSNGKFSLLGAGVENIYAPAFPAVHPRLALVVRLRAQGAEIKQSHKFRVDVSGPNNFHGPVIDIDKFELKVPQQVTPEHSNTLNLIVNISPLIFPEPGTYLFQVYIDSQEMGNFTLFAQKLDIGEVS